MSHPSRSTRFLGAAVVLLALAAIMTTSSCRRMVPPTAPDSTTVPHHDTTTVNQNPLAISGTPQSVGIIGIKALASLGNSGDFELDLLVNDSLGNPVLNLPPALLASLVAMDSAPGAYTSTIASLAATGLAAAKSASCGPFSAELLLDQSNSMAYNDPLNLRLQAAKIFMDGVTLLGGGDEAQLSSFFDFENGYDGLRSYGPFTANGMLFNPSIDALAGNLGPSTPLYDAMFQETDSLVQQGHNPNKVLVVFTDGEDNDSYNTLWSAIDHAKSQGVKVFAVALKTGINLPLITTAMSTGGSVMHTQDPSQLPSYFGSLGKQMHGGQTYYKSTWHVTVPNAASLSGHTVSGTVQIGTGSSAVMAPFAVTFQ